MVNDEMMISPIAKRGRSSFTHVITSPGLSEGVGTATLVGAGVASGVTGTVAPAVGGGAVVWGVA